MQKTSVYNDSSRTAQTTIKADRSPSTVVITCAQALVCLFVCFLAGLRKTTQSIFTKFDGNVAHGPRKKSLDFGGNPGNRNRNPHIICYVRVTEEIVRFWW